jgi:hypothetical protein
MSHRASHQPDPTTPSPRATSPSRRPNRRTGRIAGVVLIAGALAVTATACSDDEGSGDLATIAMQDFVDPEIHAVKLLDDFDVRITVDPAQAQAATFTIDDNLVERGDVNIEGDLMTIDFDGFGDVEPSETPIIELTLKRLESVENYSDSVVTVTGVDSDELSVVNTEDGTVTATGTVDRLDVRSTSDAALDLSQLTARRVNLVDTDDGPITVHATEVIEGSISGDANVTLLGHPGSTDVDLDGDGQLIAA